MYLGATFLLRQRESQSRPAKGRQAVVAGQAMTFHEYLSKAVQHDAQQAGERDRLLLVARRARMARPERVGPAAPQAAGSASGCITGRPVPSLVPA